MNGYRSNRHAVIVLLVGTAGASCSGPELPLVFLENRAAAERLYESHTRGEFTGQRLRYVLSFGADSGKGNLRARITDPEDRLGVKIAANAWIPSKTFDCLPVVHPDPGPGCEAKVLGLKNRSYFVDVYAKEGSARPQQPIAFYLFVSVTSSNSLPGLKEQAQ